MLIRYFLERQIPQYSQVYLRISLDLTGPETFSSTISFSALPLQYMGAVRRRMENRRRYTQRTDLVFVLKIFGSSSCLLGFEIFSAFSFAIYWVGLVQNRRNSKKKEKPSQSNCLGHLVPVVIIFYKKNKKRN